MRGHWIGGTRKLNTHWQSGGEQEFSRWFTTIKYDDDYYCFAPSYRFDEMEIEYKDQWPGGSIYTQLKEVWTDIGTVTLTPSFNGKMNVNGSYTLEDIRENATIFTRTLTDTSRVKVIIPTFKLALKLQENKSPYILPTGYKYMSTPTIPTGAEILWQDNSAMTAYESRYEDSLGIDLTTWNGWAAPRLYEGHTALNTLQYMDIGETYSTPDSITCEFTMGFYNKNTSISGVPDAVNLMSPIMMQRYSGDDTNLIIPFNDYIIYSNHSYDNGDSKYYWILIKWSLVSLALQERTII